MRKAFDELLSSLDTVEKRFFELGNILIAAPKTENQRKQRMEKQPPPKNKLKNKSRGGSLETV